MSKVLIVGGGISGLTIAILLQKAGYEVMLFERKKYPFHRVCGEYISNEALPLLHNLGIFPHQSGASTISELELSTVSGKSLQCDLPLGGFGYSRYELDNALYKLAKSAGVSFVFEKVTNIQFRNGEFELNAGTEVYHSPLAIAAYGKRSNLDQQLNRNFFYKRSPYLGIKYHIQTDLSTNLIRLDNFPGGYAGICKIEGDKYNLCYLTKRSNLKFHGSIPAMERKVLSQNPNLKKIFEDSDFGDRSPEVINEISFEQKTLVENHLLFCGDSAGMITPLCGNGMAMAFHSAKMLSELIIRYYPIDELPDRKMLEFHYHADWNKLFASRLKAGRIIQSAFGNKLISSFALAALQKFPAMSRKLISKTHGREILSDRF